MKIEITEQQQQILLDIINNTSFKGSDSQIIVDLKNAVSTAIKPAAQQE